MPNWIRMILGLGTPTGDSSKTSGIRYLEMMGYPESVIVFFRDFDQRKEIEINEIRLSHSDSIKEENQEAIPGYVISPLGYLNIGTTIYGDCYCLDTNTLNANGGPVVVLASHDEIEEESTPEEIKQRVIRVSDSFEEFIDKLHKSELPSDYYDIKSE